MRCGGARGLPRLSQMCLMHPYPPQYFDWTHGEVTAEFKVSQEHVAATAALGIEWDHYKRWDLITLTQHYTLLLTEHIRRHHSEGQNLRSIVSFRSLCFTELQQRARRSSSPPPRFSLSNREPRTSCPLHFWLGSYTAVCLPFTLVLVGGTVFFYPGGGGESVGQRPQKVVGASDPPPPPTFRFYGKQTPPTSLPL